MLIAMVLHAAATAASCLYTLFSSRFAGHTVWHCDRARESLLSLLHSGLQQPFACVCVIGFALQNDFLASRVGQAFALPSLGSLCCLSCGLAARAVVR